MNGRRCAVLGIDAAWTTNQPSGVALVESNGEEWRCVAVAPNYDEFISRSEGRETAWHRRTQFPGSRPSVHRLLDAARALTTAPIEVVAVDMPLSTEPIIARRAADNAVSAEFGSRLCATHSPTPKRPGVLSAELTSEFREAGYPLATTADDPTPCLIEVYPHPALLSLLNRPQRVPYKVSKSGKYWKGTGRSERIANLLVEHRAIEASLCDVFSQLGFSLPEPDSGTTLTGLKRYEDALDALVCAWVGVQYLHGKTTALGDQSAAIWVPSDVVLS